MAKSEWYDLSRILKEKADFNIIYGMRSNGKTYGIIDYCLQNKLKLAYIRRYYEEITKHNISKLFDAHLGDWKNNEYNQIVYKSRNFYFAKLNENGDIIKQSKDSICEVFALNTWERSKGQDRGKFDIIVFDEFLTATGYLENELFKFKQLLSSLIRTNPNVQVFLLGNTVNKYCPYFSDFEITDIVKNLKMNEIRTKIIGQAGTKVAVEYAKPCERAKKVSKFFDFGRKKTMITSGVWEIDEYPHIYETIHKDEILKTAYIIDEDFNLAIDIIQKSDRLYLRVRNSTRNIDIEKNIVYCSIPSPNILHSTSVFNTRNKIHKIIANLIKEKQVYFTDNEIGEKWENYIKNSKRKDINIVYKLT